MIKIVWTSLKKEKISFQPVKGSALHSAHYTLHTAPAPTSAPAHVNFILHTEHCTLHTTCLYCVLHIHHSTLHTVKIWLS